MNDRKLRRYFHSNRDTTVVVATRGSGNRIAVSLGIKLRRIDGWRKIAAVLSHTKLQRAALAVSLVLSILVAPLAVEAQQAPAKVWRIGMLWYGSSLEDPATRVRSDAFQQGLREQGYVEGRNVAFEHRHAQGKYELFSDLAAELVRLKVDVIVTPGNTPATLAAKQATRTPDPVALGLVVSVARPGGNITGLISTAGPEIVGK